MFLFTDVSDVQDKHRNLKFEIEKVTLVLSHALQAHSLVNDRWAPK